MRRPRPQPHSSVHTNRAPEPGASSSQSAFVPDAVEVQPRQARVGGEWIASFAVTGYPRQVHPGWLHPLVTYPARVDVSVHIAPMESKLASERLQKQLAKLESGRAHSAERGRIQDAALEAATEDAYALSDQLARGEARLFRFGLYLTVHAPTEQQLADDVHGLQSLAASLLLEATPTTYRALQGWVSCLPLGLDQIRQTRTLDTSSLAAAFPFTSPDLPPPDPASAAAPSGVLYGHNLGSQGLVHWDRFAQENYNAVLLGRSGAGKSYLVKLETLRNLYRGVEVSIIDPEDEYSRLARAVGGTPLPLGTEHVTLNPLDIPLHTRADGRRSAPPDALTQRCLFLHTLLPVLFGQALSADERAVLDQAVTATYQRAGITSDDPRTWTKQAPLLGDLRDTLAASDHATASELAARLQPFTDGAFAGLFNAPTSLPPEGHLVVFSLKHLPAELKPAGTLLALDIVWRRVAQPAHTGRRLCVVDEAWLLMQQQAGAEFLWRMAKSARKHWTGLTVATQDVGDVLSTELGKAIVANAATQILLRQATQTIGEIAEAFSLSRGEQQALTSADTGVGLLISGPNRVAFQASASNREHELITTDPAELAAMHDEAANSNDGTGPDLDASGEIIIDE